MKWGSLLSSDGIKITNHDEPNMFPPTRISTQHRPTYKQWRTPTSQSNASSSSELSATL